MGQLNIMQKGKVAEWQEMHHSVNFTEGQFDYHKISQPQSKITATKLQEMSSHVYLLQVYIALKILGAGLR